MEMLTTNEALFCEALDRRIPALANIDETFRKEGVEAAERQLADYIRSSLQTDGFFTVPYAPRENIWASDEDDDFAAAEKIIRGELCSVGFIHQFPDTAHVDWHANPTPNGYREWTWQLSRHHEWRCLGYCYRQTGDEKYAKAFVDFLMSWCEQAPCPQDESPYATDCWRTIEAGIRMTLNWHYALYAFYRSPHMTDHVMTTYIRSICDHGYRLRNFSSRGNWLIMEMAGLAHIGMLYPFLREAEDWGKYALSVLGAELDRQVYADGFQYELSTNYHDVLIMNYHRVLATAKAVGYPVPKELTDRLLRLFELDIHVTCPDGRYPDLNDGSRNPLATWCRVGQNYFPDHEAIRYFATDGAEGAPPAYTDVALPYAGLAFMRTGWGKDDLWCFMDAGDFGRSHQHEDKLNILLSAYGKNLLLDSGNYAYDTSAMRGFVLDTRSHNTAMVDNLSQNRRGRYDPQSEPLDQYAGMKWSFSPEVDSVEGIYDQGYGMDYLDVTHKRKLILFKKGLAGSAPFALVIDRFLSGDGAEHTFQPSYQMAFEPYTDDGERFTADFGDGVTFTILATAPHSLVIGQTAPLFMGWRKLRDTMEANLEYKPAPCLRFALCGTEIRLVTALCPSKGEGKIVKSIKASPELTDTHITLAFTDGSTAELDEANYPCTDRGADKLFES